MRATRCASTGARTPRPTTPSRSTATPLGRADRPGEQLGLVWAPAELQGGLAREDHDGELATYQSPPMQTLAKLRQGGAPVSSWCSSPYFVPHDGRRGGAWRAERAAGVRVAILTNSLAATDAVAVQAGYAPYRVPLLRRGRRALRVPRRAAAHRQLAAVRLALAREPACQGLCDRPLDPGDRLAQPRSALGLPQYRAGPGDPQPATGGRSGRAVRPCHAARPKAIA